jgi:hypothetical protein
VKSCEYIPVIEINVEKSFYIVEIINLNLICDVWWNKSMQMMGLIHARKGIVVYVLLLNTFF